MNQLELGVGRAVITPEVGCRLCGYRTDFYSDSLHDDLTATAFWFRQDDTQALMVNLTICNLRANIRDQILELLEGRFEIKSGEVMLSCTHTHSGPMTANSIVDWPYVEGILIPGIIKAVAAAYEALRPVTVGVATGESRIGINRRQLTAENEVVLGQNPWGSYDPQMTVLSFKDEKGEIYANMVHYGCHGTCAGRHPAISRDWSGIMVDRMELLTGGITAFFNGTAGDTGPRLSNGGTTGKGDYQYVYELGNVAAQDAMRIWKTISSYRNERLKTADCTVDLPLRPRESLEEAERLLRTPIEGGSTLRNAYHRHYEEVINSYQNGYTEKECHTIREVIVRVGDVAFYGLPFETFSGIGLRVREYSDVPNPLCLGYTNGAEGYFPTRDQRALGGYEILISRFHHTQIYVDDVDFHLIKGTVENLKKV